MPVAGLFSLSLYEERLLANLEDSMVQQGRILSAWLQESPLTEDRAKKMLVSLKKKHTARIRIVDARGFLLADSSLLVADKMPDVSQNLASRYSDFAEGYAAKTTFLYRVLSFPVRVARKYLIPPETPLESADFYSGKTILDGTEMAQALSGSYGAVTRISSGGQNSVTLYSAIPIINGGDAIGAVLVSQSTYRILESLYDFRLEIGKVFVLSVLAAALVSLLLALTISRPLSRLKKEAEAVIAGGGSIEYRFHQTGRNDEIDRLSSSLTSLVRDLHRHIALSENFASDAAHEMRNRISGIRNAAELIPGESPEEVNTSVSLILEDAARMEKALSALRELSKIEALPKDSRTDKIDVILSGVVSAVKLRYPGLTFELAIASDSRRVSIPVTGEHLEIIAENILENAASFSPTRGTVFIAANRDDGRLIIEVRDQGMGIPEEHRSRVFDRFFSWRGGNKTDHAGIGLSIVEAVMRKTGGSVFCANHAGGGAVFTLIFPM